MDKIIIKNLLVRGILGLNPDERVKEQDILVNLTLFTDIKNPGISDDPADAVDYKQVKLCAMKHIEESSDHLVEKLTTDIARILLTKFERIDKISVRVEKPFALRFTDSVGIEIERTRNDFQV